MTKQLIVEAEVLAATAVWLKKNGWTLETISFPKGQEIEMSNQYPFFKEYLEDNFLTIEENIIFLTNGPDIIATKDGVKIKVECKGYCNATAPTLRNNFDRALSSCVTYFDDTNIKLGLAIPDYYKKDVQKRVPVALRKALKMSIFLLNTTTNVVDHYEPTDII